MTISDTVTIIAMLVAPFLAVFAQKQIEIWRTQRDTKLWIFKTLMATRKATLSADHVHALNMIDLEFSIKKPKEKDVRRIWKEYLDHLGSLPIDMEERNAVSASWTDKSKDYLADLLVAMGQCLGYGFDKVDIRNGLYSPEGHAQDEYEIRAMRFHLLQLLQGKGRLPVTTSIIPVDEDAAEFGEKFQNSLLDILNGKSELRVKATAATNEKQERSSPKSS